MSGSRGEKVPGWIWKGWLMVPMTTTCPPGAKISMQVLKLAGLPAHSNTIGAPTGESRIFRISPGTSGQVFELMK